MKEFSFNFNNTGDRKNNDVVYQEQEFVISDDVHIFDLHPNNQTSFWRFGMAFSPKPDFQFDPEKGRYADRGVRFIELDAGALDNQGVTLTRRLEISRRHVAGDSILFRTDNYRPYSRIQLVLRRMNKMVEISLISENRLIYIELVEMNAFLYCKTFAWADYHRFELEMKATILEQSEFAIWDKAPLVRHDYAVLALPDGYEEFHGSQEGQDVTDLITEVERKFRNRKKKAKRYGLANLQPGSVLLVIAGTPACSICMIQAVASTNPEAEPLPIRFFNRLKFTPYIHFNLLQKQGLYEFPPEENAYELTPVFRTTLERLLKTAYVFPRFDLTEDEKSYLEILYKNLLEGKELDSVYRLPQTWQQHAADFEVNNINQLLLLGQTNISLYGIAAAHPESHIFHQFDEVLYAIKKHLSTGGDIVRVETQYIINQIPGFTQKDLNRIYRLMHTFYGLTRGHSDGPDGIRSFTLEDKSVLDTYKSYNGLSELVSRSLEQRKAGNILPASYLERMPVNHTSRAAALIGKTKLHRKARHTMEPVMGVKMLALDMAELIMELPEEKGQMIGIFGKWGRGKTFFLGELWKVLEPIKRTQFTKITFDAWKYKEAPASWAYFYEVVAAAYLGEKKGRWGLNCIRYQRKLIKLNFKRKGIWPFLKNLFAIGPAIYLSCLAYVYDRWLATIVVAPALFLGLVQLLKKINKEYSTKALNLIKTYSIRHSYKETLGIQAELQEELVTLLKTWISKNNLKKKRILLVVEDLDRCGQEKVMETIDALRLLLDEEEISKRMTVITLVDERILKEAVYQKLPDLNKKDQPDSNEANTNEKKQWDNRLISEYLDKIFISAIKLGSLSASQRREFAIELLQNTVIIDTPVESVPEEMTGIPSDYAAVTAVGSSDRQFSAPVSDAEGPGLADTQEALAPPMSGITKKEREFIIDEIQAWENMTPRSLYVFYYRYLLAKNMLLGNYPDQTGSQSWQSDQGIKDLLRIIRYFSDQYDPESISTSKTKALKSNAEIYAPDEIKPAIKRSKQDWLNLLGILEIIIAY